MRIGIVAEGPTDVVAITNFLEHSLRRREIAVDFVELQPDPDNTLPRGGWASVLKWLDNTPPDTRTMMYFGGGLFSNNLSAKACDVILLHLDSDVLSEPSFRRYVASEYNHSVNDAVAPSDRGLEVRAVICIAGRMAELTQKDAERHVSVAAVESTEAWCVAAFAVVHGRNAELFRGTTLVEQFMTALHRSENRPVVSFSSINKNLERRSRFCARHAVRSDRVEAQCEQYQIMVETLVRVHMML